MPINAEFAGLPRTTYVSDLSEGGVFVHTRELLEIGTELEVRFTVLLDDPVLLVAKGRVVRHQSDPAGMGIEFTQLDADVVLRIHDVIARGRPRDLGPPLRGPTDPEKVKDAAHSSGFAGDDFGVEMPTGQWRAIHEAAGRDDDDDDPDNAKTLVALRPVDLEIIDDEDGDTIDPQLARKAPQEDER